MNELQQVTDGVWMFPPNPDPEKVQPSVGVICSDAHTILIDTGNGPPHAERIKAVLQQIQAPPVSHIIYTHAHWDHVWGACAWKVPVIAHESCAASMREMAAVKWSVDYLGRNTARINSADAMAAAVTDWGSFEIVVPQQTFSEKQFIFSFDDLTMSLEWVGGGHSPDSTIVRFANVMFLGDCFYPPPGGADVNWAMLRGLLDDSIDFYIDGHDGLNTRAQVEAMLESI